ncbi:MAG: N-acetylmuramoyl-L-alanine amidase, partial [Acidobacteriota bacterium]
DISRRLAKLIEDGLGSEVVLTRSEDVYLSPEQRTEIANQQRADLFISIHANSSLLKTAAGVETYYLNFTTSQEALEVAARENASSERNVADLGDLIKKIALKDKMDESREFAGKVQSALLQGSMRAGNRTRDRGVRKAPFIVLVGAAMPSILAEVGFLSNSKEEALLKKPDYRQKIAEALFRGVSQYANTLSHFSVAQRSSND